MEKILHHLLSIKPCETWDILHINWCRISSINSRLAGAPKAKLWSPICGNVDRIAAFCTVPGASLGYSKHEKIEGLAHFKEQPYDYNSKFTKQNSHMKRNNWASYIPDVIAYGYFLWRSKNVSKKWRNPEKQLRLVVYPTIFVELSTAQVVLSFQPTLFWNHSIWMYPRIDSPFKSPVCYRDLHDLFFLLKSMPFNKLVKEPDRNKRSWKLALIHLGYRLWIRHLQLEHIIESPQSFSEPEKWCLADYYLCFFLFRCELLLFWGGRMLHKHGNQDTKVELEWL